MQQLLDVVLTVGGQGGHTVFDAERVKRQNVVAMQPHCAAVDEIEETAEDSAAFRSLLQVQRGLNTSRTR